MFQHLTGRIKNKVTTAEKVRPLPDKARNMCVFSTEIATKYIFEVRIQFFALNVYS